METSPKSAMQSVDIVTQILRKIDSPRDLRSASAVCRTWRSAANDPSQLRSWTLDDPLTTAEGAKVSVIPMLPKTPQPRHWINPAVDSPLASFKTPRSLRPLSFPSISEAVESGSGDGESPRTPSPLQQPPAQTGNFKLAVTHKMVMGRFLGDVDICSSHLSDECLQIITRNCPRLHTLRLLHICGAQQAPPTDAFLYPNRAEMEPFKNGSYLPTSCLCSSLSEKGFLDIGRHCPDLMSVTLVFQHIVLREVFQDILAELGKLIKLHTLSIELRMPLFVHSVKSEVIWESYLRCTDKEILALLEAGPPPLQALALNRCDLTEVSINALTKACPNIEAIDLYGRFQVPKDQGLLSGVPLGLKDLTSLSAAAFGVIHDLEECQFAAWNLQSLKRLRLESREPLSMQHLESLQCSCPQLESLHLIWNGYSGPREAQIYPFTHEGIMDYVRSVFV